MAAAYFVLLMANVFFIVYYRLMIHYVGRLDGAVERAGLAVVLSLPPSEGLGDEARTYRRRYWIAVLAMALLVAAGLAWRYPYIAAGFRTMDL